MDVVLRNHINETRAAHAKRHDETHFEDLGVELGPLTQAMRDESRWRESDHLYPAWQVYANEIEAVLEYAQVAGQLGRYWPRLIARRTQHDSALDELRVARHFQSKQFQIVEWEPAGQGERKGEYLVRGPLIRDVFVEVKGPRWEGELKPEEIQAGRTKQPKDLYLEARAIAPWKQIQLEVDKAYENSFLQCLIFL